MARCSCDTFEYIVGFYGQCSTPGCVNQRLVKPTTSKPVAKPTIGECAVRITWSSAEGRRANSKHKVGNLIGQPCRPLHQPAVAEYHYALVFVGDITLTGTGPSYTIHAVPYPVRVEHWRWSVDRSAWEFECLVGTV